MKTKAINLQRQRNMLPYAIGGLVVILGMVGYLLAGMPTLDDFGRWKNSILTGIKNTIALPQKIAAYNDQRLEAETHYNTQFYQKSLASSSFIYDSLRTDNQRLHLDLAQIHDRLENHHNAFYFYEKTIQNSEDNYFRSVAYQQCGNLIFRAIFPSILNLNPKSLEDKPLREVALNWLENAKYGQKNAQLFARERKLLQTAFEKDKKFSCHGFDRTRFIKMLAVPAMLEASHEMRNNQSNNTEILHEFCQVHTDNISALTERQLIERGLAKADMMLLNENFTRLDKSELEAQAQGEILAFLKSGNPNISRALAEKFLQLIRTNSRKKAQAVENSMNPETARYLVDFYDVIMEFYKRALKIFPQNDEARINYEILKKLKREAEKKAQQLQENQPEKSEEEKQKEQQENQENNQQQQSQNQSEQQENQSENQQNQDQNKAQNSPTQKQNQGKKNQQSDGGESTQDDAKDAQNSEGKGTQPDGSESQNQQGQAGESQDGDKGTKEMKDVTELRSKNKNYEKGDISRAQQSLKALEEREVQYLQQMQRRPHKTQPKRKKADW